jgi:hypothetical protein
LTPTLAQGYRTLQAENSAPRTRVIFPEEQQPASSCLLDHGGDDLPL